MTTTRYFVKTRPDLTPEEAERSGRCIGDELIVWACDDADALEQAHESGYAEACEPRRAPMPEEMLRDARADFVRIGYDGAGAMHFRIGLPADFEHAAAILEAGPEGYNAYSVDRVRGALGEVWDQLSDVEFGREYSPVLYAIVPHWTHQAHGGPHSGEPLAEEWCRAIAIRFLEVMRAAGAEEVSWRGCPTPSGTVPEGWYTGPESIPDDVRVYSLRAWWD